MKILAIGCSFTNYCWPTWADFLGAENYGLSGIGNDRIFYIFNQLYENLHNYDLVVIQWTSPYRFDYRDGKDQSRSGWTYNDGNIAHSTENKEIWKRLSFWYNEEFEHTRTRHFIQAIKAMCKAKNINTYHMSMGWELIKYCDHGIGLLEEHRGYYKFNKNPGIDEHPAIDQHHQISNVIKKRYEIDTSKQAKREYLKMHDDIVSGKYLERKEVYAEWKRMKNETGRKQYYPDIFQL
jgi:hypothetical protein